jgi:Tfp pilus assembly protein FimT
MVVVGIMAIALTMGVPIVYKTLHKPPLTKAVSDVIDVCSAARARAILQGQPTYVVFHPQQGNFEVSGGSGTGAAPVNNSGSVVQVRAPGTTYAQSGQIDKEHVSIDMLDINLSEYREAEEARVCFYPNGMCDEMTLILRNDAGVQRGITLEITTGLTSVLNSADLQNLRK